MTRINTNVSSLVAQNVLGRSNSSLQSALTRLSTGLRINTGADDPAGLIASEALRSDIVSTEKAISNSERANQVIATADSSLGQVSSLLNDIRGLVVEAANTGAMSDEEIAANQLQVDSSLEALNRVAQTTTFQGRKLLDGGLDFLVTGSTGFTTVDDLRIDQANLGATGSIDVDVAIATAATKAQITNAIPDTATAQFTLDSQSFTVNSVASAGLDAVNISTEINNGSEGTARVTIDGHDFQISGADGEALDTDTVVTRQSNGDFTARGTITLDGTDVTIQADDGETFDNTVVSVQKAAMGATADSANIVLTDDGGTTTATFTIAATTTGAAAGQDSITVNVAERTGTTTANYVSATGVLTIYVDDTEATVDEAVIKGAVEAASIDGVDGGAASPALFTASRTAGGDLDAVAGAVVRDATSDTALAREEATAAYSVATNTVTLTLNSDLTNVTGADVLAALNTLAQFSGDAKSTVSGPTNIAVADVTASATYGTMVRPGVLASYAANTLTIDFDGAQSSIAISEVITAVDGVSEFANTRSTSTSGTINGTSIVAGPTTVGTLADIDGAVAYFDTGSDTLTLVFDGSDSAVTADEVETAIDALTAYFENTSSTGTGTIDATALTATSSLATGGRVQDLVVKISGEYGAEALTFEAGTTFTQIANAIEAISDATGVSAAVVGSQLTLTSSNYGSDAFVDIEVISEGSGGTFETNLNATRETGTDVDATVNGVGARGDGNTLSINTATLDLTMTVDDGSSDSVSFSIDGGGALFQLGPDVVSNQQARLGIQSVSTASLGGPSGRLYQLGSGKAGALDTDTTLAMRIVDEVTSKVTGLRGRLGAFQRTTLDTNIAALGDTLVNITDAESMIRDADFAMETANLTRAQILVQSGTSILAIANSSPQNVLALLR